MNLRPLGYTALIQKYHLAVMPHYCSSYLLNSGVMRVERVGEQIQTFYPAKYDPGESDGEQLGFALKYEGVHLSLLNRLFQLMPPRELCAYLIQKPTGKYARRIWFLYEFLTGHRLALPDLQQGNYTDLLEPERYYVNPQPDKVSRQRINVNFWGTSRFCPVVRRTEILKQFEQMDLSARCSQVIAAYSPHLLKRALGYLYTRETRSSFEIEQEQPTTDRVARFVKLLQLAERDDFCQKAALIDLQNRTVDPRFCDKDYRQTQNYVGETAHWHQEIIHFVAPKPEDLPKLMAGLIETHQKMGKKGLSPVIHAAIIAYGFVFFHPFEDGNGRIHRFLMHNILARRGFSPKGIMFPLSAWLLKQPLAYEASLDAFSKPLMPLLDYDLDSEGQMTVHSHTADFYRYPDLTPQAEALFGFIQATLENELAPELAFLLQYDTCKQALQNTLDLPDRQIDLFIRFCLQNQGQLSASKRKRHFAELTDAEIAALEAAFAESASVGLFQLFH
jgi:hypothetical protein